MSDRARLVVVCDIASAAGGFVARARAAGLALAIAIDAAQARERARDAGACIAVAAGDDAGVWLAAIAEVAPDAWTVRLGGPDGAAACDAFVRAGDAVGEAAAFAQAVRQARARAAVRAQRAALEARLAQAERDVEAARAALARQEREVTRLETSGVVARVVRGLAHELNNPLAAILGFAQRLQRRLRTDDDAVSRLDVIVEQVERCRQVVERLRDLAQPLDEEILTCQPEAAFQLALERMRGAGREPPTCTIDRPLPEVLAGPRALSRVFEAALDNARQAGARACELRGVRDGERVRLELLNDGATPSADELRNAGRPFFSGAPGRRGLGLATASALLRDQDGSIALTPRTDGAGAAAVIWLPGPQARTESVTPVVDQSLAERCILIVDDEPLVAELLHDCFTEAGWRTAEVGTFADAMIRLDDRSVRAVLADVNLPDGDGVELLRRATELRPELVGHVALVTGEGQAETLARRVGDYGALTLIKPFRLEQVQALMRAIL